MVSLIDGMDTKQPGPVLVHDESAVRGSRPGLPCDRLRRKCPRSPLLGSLGVAVVLAVSVTACESGDSAVSDESVPTPEVVALEERLAAIERAVDSWSGADDLVTAQVGAETAANLVVGAGGPGYGDRNGDGRIDGAAPDGVLPGLDGAPIGLAAAIADVGCIERDVLGGAWDDPAARWVEMETAIDAWRPAANTMPSLPSHPMRVVGWSTFTLASDSIDDAREYAGHARLHVDISADALDC